MKQGNVIDLFEGLNDLKHQILRSCRNTFRRFTEDALRIMRGLRFQATLGFALDKRHIQCHESVCSAIRKKFW